MNVADKALRLAYRASMIDPWKLLVFAILLVTMVFNFGTTYYYSKWLGVGAAFSIVVWAAIYRKFGGVAALMILYMLGNAIWFLVNPNNRYAPVKAFDLQALKFYVAESGFKLLLVLLPFLAFNINRDSLKVYGRMLAISFTMISVVMVFFSYLVHGCADTNSCGGVLMNPSMNSSMMAVTLPFIFEAFPVTIAFPFLALIVLAVLLGKSSIGLGMIVAFLCLHFISKRRMKYLVFSPLLLGLGWLHYGEREFLSSGDRFPMWEFFMSQWARNSLHWWFGTGYGTFGVFSINLQDAFHVRDGYWWLWMHNDWLEVLFTTGMVGLGLVVLTFLSGLKRFWEMKEWACLQSLLLFGIAMGLNFPLRIGLSCAFIAWLVSLALYRDNPHNQLE